VAFSLFRKKDNDPVKPASSGPAALDRASVLPQQEPARPPAPSPMDSPADSASYNLSELTIEVADAGTHLSPAEEEAVVLYANGQLAAAIESAKAAIPGIVGTRQASTWLLLFDLLQLAGDHAGFDELALQYVVEFETSPPLWRELRKAAPAARPSGPTSGAISLPANLSISTVQAELSKVLAACEKGGIVRLDASRVVNIDATAAAELLSLWPRARKLKASLQLLGADSFGKLLASKIETGRRNHAEATFWLLLMELKQTIGEQENFDNLAIDYAITFEVSPPSWDDRLVVKAAPVPAGKTGDAAAEAPSSPDRMQLSGDLVGGAADSIGKIRQFAQSHGKPVIDLSGVGRVDFETAGQLLNLGVELMQAGKMPTLAGANEPIAGLFKLMGITELMPLAK
jgi:ABC-type transporter Mla MlaB component